MNLDYEEITVLIEALDSWVDKDLAGNLLSSMLTAMVPRDPLEPPSPKPNPFGDETERNRRKETATLIKAKLIMQRRITDSRMESMISGERR